LIDGRFTRTLPGLEHARMVRTLLRVMDVKVWFYALPVALKMGSSILEAGAMALLIPLGKGIAGSDFGFLWSWPGFAQLHAVLPLAGPLSDSPNRVAFLTLVALLVLASVASAALGYPATIVAAYRNGVYAARVKAFTLERYLSFGKLYFDRMPQAHVHDVLEYARVVLRILDLAENAVNAVLRVATQLVVMVAISWPLTLLMFLVVPVMRYTDRWIVRKTGAAAARATEDELALSARVFNILSCIPLVKASRNEAQTHRRYQEAMERVRRRTLARATISAIVVPLQNTVTLGTLFVVVLVAIVFTRSDHTSELGALCAFLLIARRVMPMLWLFTDLRVGLADAWPELTRLAAVFDDRDKFFVLGGPREFHGLRRNLEIRTLDFSYHPEIPVLAGLSFEIPAGRTVAIVGETGCGKTTILSLIARLYDCPPKSIFLDGADIRSFSLESLGRRMALVSQEPWLFNDTLRNNLLFGLEREVDDAELASVLAQARLHDLVARLPHGLDTDIGDRGVKLSGGEKQRLSIARALLRNADILLLDEATASLDTRTERQVQRALEASSQGRTVIIVAHRLSTVRHADKILVMDRGRVVEEGPWTELMAADGALSRLWHAQTRPGGSRGGITARPAPTT
jgi:ATP-binding cassette, subfamily B, bacterial MsbA